MIAYQKTGEREANLDLLTNLPITKIGDRQFRVRQGNKGAPFIIYKVMCCFIKQIKE
jgi:hypothetical protein